MGFGPARGGTCGGDDALGVGDIVRRLLIDCGASKDRPSRLLEIDRVDVGTCSPSCCCRLDADDACGCRETEGPG